MDSSLIPADEDHGVWDGELLLWVGGGLEFFTNLNHTLTTRILCSAELHHQQSREIQQHLNQTQATSFLRQTVNSFVSAAERAAVSFQYKPVVDDSPNLAEFGLFHGEPLLQGFESADGYQEFPHNTPQRGGFVFLEQFRLPKAQEDAWGAVSNLDLFFSVRWFELFTNSPVQFHGE